jgi:flagellar biosynthesis regulator FlaF
MNLDGFINNLKRDRARGSLAPHQIILLIALLRLYRKNGKILNDISILNSEFQEVWNTYKNDFKTTNNKLGMPLKAFVNKGHLTIQITEQINDFRKVSELESKISQVVIEDDLILLFKTEKVEEYLISRISK